MVLGSVAMLVGGLHDRDHPSGIGLVVGGGLFGWLSAIAIPLFIAGGLTDRGGSVRLQVGVASLHIEATF